MAETALNYNIKQFTNYDITEVMPTSTENIYIPKRIEENGEVRIDKVLTPIEYVTIVNNSRIIKLGYCCKLQEIIYPIYLRMDGVFRQINIGREGMYEMQPETWKNVNDLNNPTEKTTNVVVTAVKVPKQAHFTLDCVIN